MVMVMAMVKSRSSSWTSPRFRLKYRFIFFACFLVSCVSLIWVYPRPQLPPPVPSKGEIDGGQDERVGGDKHSDRLPRRNGTKIEVPRFFKEIQMGGKRKRIGMINMEEDDVGEWELIGDPFHILFDRVSSLIEWKGLFPEWIDEEEKGGVPPCPHVPMPEFGEDEGVGLDLVVVKVPCKYPEEGWNRDVARLQMHLVAANVAVRSRNRSLRVAVLSRCRPMMEIFRCDDLLTREGDWWVYEPDHSRLDQKVALPVGSCRLPMPLWGQESNEIDHLPKSQRAATARKEAYATVLHSSEAYVCGAIVLAHSLISTGTKRDLVLLLDNSISRRKRAALALAGWRIRLIERIRNPRAKKNAYNEYNYSKFRLWQLTDYDKVVFIDSDIIVLRSLDLLFYFPEMSAAGNDKWVFNSGIMVIEPSDCTFAALMELREDVVSYNGGDQGFLNEAFVWWHRLPRRANFMKNHWSNSTAEAAKKDRIFLADPPEVYAVHYLGWKPWLCYRDYDCNWDVKNRRVYASDAAHRRWWAVHDGMDRRLQRFCGLTRRRMSELDRERSKSRLKKSPDHHWRINITDQRRLTSNLIVL
ncbi:hypothetical protein SAY87_004912 [Trapa incisa]|uniref:Hexosyltransferase n=1 Tax=Trapa incisa TaxID=236973 RepID=A0AAN7PTN7_9MYRT|nr:hypothetical protein SAY87_004912 [Trapa incisa]